MRTVISRRVNIAAAVWLAALYVGTQRAPAAPPAAGQAVPIPLEQLGAVAGRQYRGDGLSVTATTEQLTFSDTDWFSLGSGVNGAVNALAVSGSNLYVGGQFTSAGGIGASNVAKWDGNTWSALGSGVNGSVGALAVSGSDLYVAGAFTKAGGSNANYVAKWNGSAWLPLGSGLGYMIPVEHFALAVSGSNLFAWPFCVAILPGGQIICDVANWNGSGWSVLEPGLNLCPLVASGSDLYGSSSFNFPGGERGGYVAKWDGSEWSDLGSGVFGSINALAVSGSEVYAGSTYFFPDGHSYPYVAKWDGSEWAVLGSEVGVGSTVNALAVSGSDLYAGGNFSTVGGSSANCLAKWDGSVWSALGSGVGGLSNSCVFAMAVLSSDLYVGGSFSTAGGKPSAYVARAHIGPARGRLTNCLSSPVTGFSCTFSDGSLGQPYRIQTSPSLAGDSWTDLTNFTYAGPTIITDTSAVSTTNTFYRAVTP